MRLFLALAAAFLLSAVAFPPAADAAYMPGVAGCAGQNLSSTTITPFSLTASTQIIAGAASKKTYICAINIVSASAENVAIVEGTGTVCATGIAGMAGGTTAAAGWNFAANGGLTEGDGSGTIMLTATAADNVCLLLSGTTQVSGTVTWAQF